MSESNVFDRTKTIFNCRIEIVKTFVAMIFVTKGVLYLAFGVLFIIRACQVIITSLRSKRSTRKRETEHVTYNYMPSAE
jgi:hypothetical protein